MKSFKSFCEAEKVIKQFFSHSTIHNDVNEAKKTKKIPLSPSERDEVKVKFGHPGCSFAKDKSGIYCYTQITQQKLQISCCHPQISS